MPKSDFPRHFKQELPCELPVEDLRELALELASKTHALKAYETEFKRLKNERNEEIRQRKGVLDNLAAKIVDGAEPRIVDCEERVDEDDWSLEVWRRDTNELVERRKMDPGEISAYQQGALELDDSDQAGEATEELEPDGLEEVRRLEQLLGVLDDMRKGDLITLSAEEEPRIELGEARKVGEVREAIREELERRHQLAKEEGANNVLELPDRASA